MIRRLVAGGLALAAVAAGASGFAPKSAARPGPPPKVFAFLASGSTGIDHLRRYGSRISVVAPEWYDLQLTAGALTGTSDPAVEALARSQGVAVWPVVNGDFSGTREITHAAARQRIAGVVAAAARARGYDGLTLDLEQLPRQETADFTALVRDIAIRLHAQHQRLAVYVPRRTAGGGDTAYDWASLARIADLLIASGYNEHSWSSRPGPVTTAAGFAHMLAYAAGVSRARVAPAIGAFGYSWPTEGGSGQLISTLAAQALLQQTGAHLHGSAGDAYFSADGRVVHYQTGNALDARARDARAVGMRWLALFSLGREPDAFWNRIITARQVTQPAG